MLVSRWSEAMEPLSNLPARLSLFLAWCGHCKVIYLSLSIYLSISASLDLSLEISC